MPQWIKTMNKILQKRIEEVVEKIVCSVQCAYFALDKTCNCYAKKFCIKTAEEILQNQWISVEEALPESIVQRVLVVNHHFPFDVYFGRYEYGKWIIEGESEDLWITHWMPIPELKGGNE